MTDAAGVKNYLYGPLTRDGFVGGADHRLARSGEQAWLLYGYDLGRAGGCRSCHFSISC